ncbi:hypothetical protein HBN50_10025 [Halobacteriovorax sp. GB3]|uniref:hypothetical protein n=1 Tax=Halobacteriovorax sp. GB3 TaxID=2719615 RepID=UPI00235F4FC3|nr:hypothetical protein [Halobacteriovorax sp. GB3]MDD0853437.1 hypothetical protein [Halobacteriovorax sp. GB3]
MFDIFTLGRIDDRFNIYGQSFYLTILYSIFTIQLLEIEFKRALFQKFALYLDDLLHFLTGSLLSAYSIFYFKSSSLSNSFIFMAIILAFLFLNETEFFKTRGLSVKSILISLCTISFLTYFIPMTIGRLGGDLFFLSTTLSLISLFPLAYLLHKRRQGDLLKVISSSWCGVIIIFNLLYLAKMIPPVPLSLTKIGVFYKIEKENSDYLLSQKKEFFDNMKFGESNFEYRENDRVYLYTSVFAPSEFQDTVFAVWQKKITKEFGKPVTESL